MLFRLIIISIIGFAACSEPNSHIVVSESALDAEAREDSLELVAAYESQSKIRNVVYPAIETKSVRALADDDAADDPAIWINQSNREESIVFGTNKKGGLIAFNLGGAELYYLERGKINNVDVIQDVNMGNQNYDLLTFSNRTTQVLEVYQIKSNGTLDTANVLKVEMDTTIMDDIYGVCFAVSVDGGVYALANAKNGHLQQYKLSLSDTQMSAELVREMHFEDQPEGMVADNKRGHIYVGLENTGIVKISINPIDTTITTLKNTQEANNNKLRYDLEGLAIMHHNERDYLLVSSQGNFTYAVFDIQNNDAYLGSFKVLSDDSVDGIEETDGIEIYSDSLNSQFPEGIFVAQDGFNYEGDSLISQNFKYVDLREIRQLNIFQK